MNKPLTMIVKDTKDELAKTINECGLPAFILESILQDFLTEVRVIAQKQYESDKVRYEEYLKSQVTQEA